MMPVRFILIGILLVLGSGLSSQTTGKDSLHKKKIGLVLSGGGAKGMAHIGLLLPMRDKSATRSFYVERLGFRELGDNDYPDYLMLEKDNIQIHFFAFKELDPKANYGQVYIRTNNINALYQSLLDKQASIHPAGHLQTKAWKQGGVFASRS